MFRIILAAFGLLLLTSFASAQNATVTVVTSCGGQSLNVGTPSILTVDTTGKLCTNAVSSGSITITSPLGPTTAPSAAVSITDTGAPITGQSLGSGGQGLIGWLSQLNATANTGTGSTGAAVPTTAIQIGCAYNSSLPSATNGDLYAEQCDASARQLMNVAAGAFLGAPSAAAPASAAFVGGSANSAEPTKTTTTYQMPHFLDLVGKQVTSPYANRENYLRCAVTITSSTAATTCTGMGAQGANVKIYITDLTCTRSDAGTTAVTMTLNDSATTIFDMPNNGGGGGFSHTFNVPLAVAANTAFQITSGTSIASEHCSAEGYAGY